MEIINLPIDFLGISSQGNAVYIVFLKKFSFIKECRLKNCNTSTLSVKSRISWSSLQEWHPLIAIPYPRIYYFSQVL